MSKILKTFYARSLHCWKVHHRAFISSSMYSSTQQVSRTLVVSKSYETKLIPLVSSFAKRYKYNTAKKGGKPDKVDDDKDDADDEYYSLSKDTKNYNLTSLRADLLLKTGLGLSRNKIEEMFYDSRIRVNGKKITKKSTHVNVGDEIDMVKGPSPKNPNFLVVGRIEVLGASPREDGEGLTVKLRKSKSLLIENYNESNAWKPSEKQGAEF